jgi:hypothetical protein
MLPSPTGFLAAAGIVRGLQELGRLLRRRRRQLRCQLRRPGPPLLLARLLLRGQALCPHPLLVLPHLLDRRFGRLRGRAIICD